MAAHAAECRRRDIPYLYDPSQQVTRLSGEEMREGFRGAAILIVNDYESGILGQKTGLGLEALQGEVPVVIVTHGPDGSTIHARSAKGDVETHAIPAARVEGEAVDPTGVGDMYRAGLLRGRRIGAPWPVAGRIGSINAVFGLEALGPQPPALHARRVPRALPTQLRRRARARPPLRLDLGLRLQFPFFRREGSPLSMRVPRRVAASFSPRQFEGSLDARGLRFGVVCARWNPTITDALLAAALETLKRRGARSKDVSIARVPGAFELPAGARALAEAAKPHALIALAAIVKGETTHHEVLGHAVASALAAPLGRHRAADRVRPPDLRHDGTGAAALGEGRRGGRGRDRDGHPAPRSSGTDVR